MDKDQSFDFESFKQEAIKGMYAGKPLNGEKGIFAPLLKHFLEAAIAGEMEAHLQEEKAAGRPNRKNGKTSKKVKSLSGEFELESSRDRLGSFEPLWNYNSLLEDFFRSSQFLVATVLPADVVSCIPMQNAFFLYCRRFPYTQIQPALPAPWSGRSNGKSALFSLF